MAYAHTQARGPFSGPSYQHANGRHEIREPYDSGTYAASHNASFHSGPGRNGYQTTHYPGSRSEQYRTDNQGRDVMGQNDFRFPPQQPSQGYSYEFHGENYNTSYSDQDLGYTPHHRQPMPQNRSDPSRGLIPRQNVRPQAQQYQSQYHESNRHESGIRTQNEGGNYNGFDRSLNAPVRTQHQAFETGQYNRDWQHGGKESTGPQYKGPEKQNLQQATSSSRPNFNDVPEKRTSECSMTISLCLSANEIIAVANNHLKGERMIPEPMSPETVSWDNPFPTFPTNKKKGDLPAQTNLNASIAEMSISSSLAKSRPGDQQNRGALSGSEYMSNHNHLVNSLEPSDHWARRNARSQDEEIPNGFRSGPSTGYGGNERQYQQSSQKLLTNADFPGPTHQIRREMGTGNISGQDRYPKNAGEGISPALRQPYDAITQRSKTMPNAISESLGKFGPQQGHIDSPDVRGYTKPMEHRYDSTNSYARGYGPQQQRPLMHSRSQSTETGLNYRGSGYQGQATEAQATHAQHDSIGEVFDSYYDSPHHSISKFDDREVRNQQSVREEELHKFEVIPPTEPTYRRGMTTEQHLQPYQKEPGLPPVPKPDYEIRNERSIQPELPQFPRNESSPRLNNGRGPVAEESDFNFELPGSVPAMPPSFSPYNEMGRREKPLASLSERSLQQGGPLRPPPHETVVRNRSDNGAPRSAGTDMIPRVERPEPDRSRSDPSQNYPSTESQMRNRPGNGLNQGPRAGLKSPSPPRNPDALPHHPAPVRPGLMKSSPTDQAPKPPPIRRYNSGSSPLEESTAGQRPQISRSPSHGQTPPTVTLGELERLRQDVRMNPSDQKTHLLLAKRLEEAASVLVDEGGRADQKTRSKNRERYMGDAHKTVKRLVHNGYPDAIFFFGDCYSRGSLGLDADAKEAFSLYQSAAKAGHAQAAYRVAVCCEIGLEEGGGTKRDPLKAMQWYERAATLGDTPAMYKMGIIQLKGLLGQQKNATGALMWLKRAAERADKENPHALHELALLHESPNNNDGVAKDEAYARRLFTQAANLGYKFSQFRLGCAYEYGLLGCTIDPRQSIAWYSKAAVQEEHQSELALSGWYLTGAEGVLQQSDTEAYLWARKAAQAGLAKAEYAMGYFTEVGIGAPSNLEDAKRWYWRSASQNFPKARERLEDLRRGGAKMQKTRVSRSKMNKQTDGECIVM
ncbi:MAG: hypothetical protein Q9167_001917 [Letrouitia subvulpina]